MPQSIRMTVFAGLALISIAGPATAQGNASGTAQLPGWMAGCWQTAESDGERSEECWTAPHGAMMLGSGHLFDASKTLSFEHMRIAREKGALVFIAQPNGAPSTRFTLEKHAPAEVSFVNRANDYPQRVTYRLADGDLEAEIAMLDGTKTMKWQFKQATTAGR